MSRVNDTASPWGPAFGAFGPPMSPRTEVVAPAPKLEGDDTNDLEDIDIGTTVPPASASNQFGSFARTQSTNSFQAPIPRTASGASRASLNQPLASNHSSSGKDVAWSTKSSKRILAALLVVVVSTEVLVLCIPSVPWIVDKAFFVVCLAFQAILGLSLLPCCARRIRSKIIDVCHWAFVVLVYLGAIILTETASVLLIALLALATVVLRIAMGNHCVITMVAQQSSLPNISDRQATSIFVFLLVISVSRLCLLQVYGSGSMIDHVLAVCGYSHRSITAISALWLSSLEEAVLPAQ